MCESIIRVTSPDTQEKSEKITSTTSMAGYDSKERCFQEWDTLWLQNFHIVRCPNNFVFDFDSRVLDNGARHNSFGIIILPYRLSTYTEPNNPVYIYKYFELLLHPVNHAGVCQCILPG